MAFCFLANNRIYGLKTMHTKNDKLTFKAAYGWHDWTVNPEFNKIGNIIGAYWVARTWRWNFLTGDNQPGGPYDIAYFSEIDSTKDYQLHAEAYGLGDPHFYTHCAGATQGWVWDFDPPGNITKDDIFQPTPLRITSSIGQLKSKTNFLWYTHAFFGTWGVLSNVWFKVKHIYDARSGYFFDGILGIDFYYESGGQVTYDGAIRK